MSQGHKRRNNRGFDNSHEFVNASLGSGQQGAKDGSADNSR